MSTAVALIFVALFLMPWTVAGVIYPPAALAGKWSRWKLFLVGFTAFLVIIVIAGILLAPETEGGAPTNDIGSILGGVWLLTCFLWPLIAIVSLITHRRRSKAPTINEPAPTKERSELPSQKPFKPLTNTQRKSANLPTNEPVKPAKKPKIIPEPKSRAIRTGWELCRVAFEYEDSNGDWSTRQVTVHSVTSTYIKGECHERRAERTFRLDRVQSDITDLDTGEILRSDVWAKIYR